MRTSHTEPHWHTADPFPDRRAAARIAHAERVTVATPWGDVEGMLLDVSSTGGQVRVANGLVPFEGDEIAIRFVGAGQYGGRIAWTADGAIGIIFDQPIAEVHELLWLEQRAPEWYGRVAFARRQPFVWG